MIQKKTRLSVNDYQKGGKGIVKKTLTKWKKIVKKIQFGGRRQTSPKFRPGEMDSTFVRGRNKGITAIVCALLEGRNLKTFGRLKREFGLENRDLYR